MAETTVEEIQELLDAGYSKKDAAEHLGITPQALGRILKKGSNDEVAVKGELVSEMPPHSFAKEYAHVARTGEDSGSKIVIMTAGEYREYSEANGRFEGRPEGQKRMPALEEVRALINAGAKPSYIMKKYGIDAEEFKQVIWRLSKIELRDKPIGFSIEQDYIQR